MGWGLFILLMCFGVGLVCLLLIHLTAYGDYAFRRHFHIGEGKSGDHIGSTDEPYFRIIQAWLLPFLLLLGPLGLILKFPKFWKSKGRTTEGKLWLTFAFITTTLNYSSFVGIGFGTIYILVGLGIIPIDAAGIIGLLWYSWTVRVYKKGPQGWLFRLLGAWVAAIGRKQHEEAGVVSPESLGWEKIGGFNPSWRWRGGCPIVKDGTSAASPPSGAWIPLPGEVERSLDDVNALVALPATLEMDGLLMVALQDRCEEASEAGQALRLSHRFAAAANLRPGHVLDLKLDLPIGDFSFSFGGEAFFHELFGQPQWLYETTQELSDPTDFGSRFLKQLEKNVSECEDITRRLSADEAFSQAFSRLSVFILGLNRAAPDMRELESAGICTFSADGIRLELKPLTGEELHEVFIAAAVTLEAFASVMMAPWFTLSERYDLELGVQSEESPHPSASGRIFGVPVALSAEPGGEQGVRIHLLNEPFPPKEISRSPRGNPTFKSRVWQGRWLATPAN